MIYVKNAVVQSQDYNNFAGSTTDAAVSAAEAQNKAGYLWGTGFGDRGYGQTAPSLQPIGGGVTSQAWLDLRTTIANIASWQNTSAALLPPSAAFNQGAPIVAHESSAPSLDAYDIGDLLEALDTNRFNYQVGNMSLSVGTASTTRATTWGAGVSGITCTLGVLFASENAARFFFNTGGEIRIRLSHPDTSTLRNQSWNNVLSDFSCAFRANSSARIGGSFGVAQAVGYYQLTTTYQMIVDGTNSGQGAYTVNDFFVSARANTITGANGAKGSYLQFQVVLTDEQTNPFSDIVAAGTVATVDILRATALPSPIALPTSQVDVAF